jgi:hypothetical protein
MSLGLKPTHAPVKAYYEVLHGFGSRPDHLVQVVNQFFAYRAAHIEEWEDAVNEFSDRMPDLAPAVFKIIEGERPRNSAFRDSFEGLQLRPISPERVSQPHDRLLQYRAQQVEG